MKYILIILTVLSATSSGAISSAYVSRLTTGQTTYITRETFGDLLALGAAVREYNGYNVVGEWLGGPLSTYHDFWTNMIVRINSTNNIPLNRSYISAVLSSIDATLYGTGRELIRGETSYGGFTTVAAHIPRITSQISLTGNIGKMFTPCFNLVPTGWYRNHSLAYIRGSQGFRWYLDDIPFPAEGMMQGLAEDTGTSFQIDRFDTGWNVDAVHAFGISEFSEGMYGLIDGIDVSLIGKFIHPFTTAVSEKMSDRIVKYTGVILSDMKKIHRSYSYSSTLSCTLQQRDAKLYAIFDPVEDAVTRISFSTSILENVVSSSDFTLERSRIVNIHNSVNLDVILTADGGYNAASVFYTNGCRMANLTYTTVYDFSTNNLTVFTECNTSHNGRPTSGPIPTDFDDLVFGGQLLRCGLIENRTTEVQSHGSSSAIQSSMQNFINEKSNYFVELGGTPKVETSRKEIEVQQPSKPFRNFAAEIDEDGTLLSYRDLRTMSSVSIPEIESESYTVASVEYPLQNIPEETSETDIFRIEHYLFYHQSSALVP